MNSKQIWRTTGPTDFSPNDLEGVGNFRTIGDKVFKWVKNASGADAVAGYVAFANATAPAAGDLAGQNAYQATTARLALMLGVWQAATPNGQYGWIQVYGECDTVLVDGTADIGIGDSLKGVNAQNYLVLGAAAGTAPLHRRHIIALEAYTTDATQTNKKGFIHCL